MPITRVDENALLGWCWRTTEQVQALRGALAAVLIEEPASRAMPNRR
jgi:hypothetical protein